jgi:FtsP/CotA-like multicopper oxidase with cupredoxin domain
MEFIRASQALVSMKFTESASRSTCVAGGRFAANAAFSPSSGRDRAVVGARRDSGLLADRHGRDFLGTYDLFADALLLFERSVRDRVTSDPAARRCPVPGTSFDLHKCPTANDPAASPYGGVRLQITPGQKLRIRLVNCLPPAVDAKHADENPLLKSNPTNLHTHGLIVEPHRADDPRDPFGDYVFVLDLPDGILPPASMPIHGGSDHSRNYDFREEVVDYEIPIDATHPPGLFWFHPHVHGLSLNQVTGGLAGIITVGDVGAYVCDRGTTCAPGQLQPQVRHLVLKDVEITSDFRVRFQENPAMCATPDATGNIGGCTGANTQAGTSTDANDGRWEFTVNGQTYPEIAIPQAGEIWRMANAQLL